MKRNSTHEEIQYTWSGNNTHEVKYYTGREIVNMKRYSTHEVEIIHMKRNITHGEKQYIWK